MDRLTLISILILAGLLAALVLWIVVAWRRTRYTFGQAFWYLVNEFFTRVLWRTEVSGPMPVAAGQGALIVSNHISGIDPLLIQLSTDRVVHWLVAREYIETFGISIVFKTLESIAVNRVGVDTAATKRAIRLLQQGGLVGLFPEGKVNMTQQLLLPGRPGVALIALRAKVPVIPCFVSGSPYDGTALGSFFMPAKTHVTIGRPIDITPYLNRKGEKGVMEEMTKRFMVEIAKLAGVDDYEPQLAGRNWNADAERLNNGKQPAATPNQAVDVVGQ